MSLTGFPSPVENESQMPMSLPIHVPPPAQFLLNHHHLPTQIVQTNQDGWTTNTLEHNLKNKAQNLNYQNNLDGGGNGDFEPTCLMRTASGSLFIPKGKYKLLTLFN